MEPFGVYIHWPFCLSKCPYCDFNSHVRDRIDQARWRAAFLTEIDHTAEGAPRRPVTSIFFGGGTPSLMPPETVGAIIERIAELWGLADDVEITAEANPTSVEREKLSALSAAGVNRVSLGVQALDNDVLRFLGRGHDAREAIAAIETAAELFGRYSFDLIYARPDQSAADWRQELGRALALAGSHLSLYQLTIERGTPFYGNWRQGQLMPLDDDAAADLFIETQEILTAAGLPAYEISNHAAAGAECRHNLLYWRYGEYAGIGPGAHGRLIAARGKLAVERRKLPERWLEQVERQGHGTRSESLLSREDRVVEMVMMGLRTNEGIPNARFLRETGSSYREVLDTRALGDLQELGLIETDQDTLKATEAGRLRLDAVLERLLF